jgi:hypothetical protein
MRLEDAMNLKVDFEVFEENLVEGVFPETACYLDGQHYVFLNAQDLRKFAASLGIKQAKKLTKDKLRDDVTTLINAYLATAVDHAESTDVEVEVAKAVENDDASVDSFDALPALSDDTKKPAVSGDGDELDNDGNQRLCDVFRDKAKMCQSKDEFRDFLARVQQFYSVVHRRTKTEIIWDGRFGQDPLDEQEAQRWMFGYTFNREKGGSGGCLLDKIPSYFEVKKRQS